LSINFSFETEFEPDGARRTFSQSIAVRRAQNISESERIRKKPFGKTVRRRISDNITMPGF
jgi:hypothetical protein